MQTRNKPDIKYPDASADARDGQTKDMIGHIAT